MKSARPALVQMFGWPSQVDTHAGCPLAGREEALEQMLSWESFLVFFDGPSESQLTMSGWSIKGKDRPSRLQLPRGIDVGDTIGRARKAFPRGLVASGKPFSLTENRLTSGDLDYWFKMSDGEITRIAAHERFCE